MASKPDNLPALIEGIERDLAEVRTMDDVRKLRDRAEQVRTFARNREVAVGIWNSASAMVLLCEHRIGSEVAPLPKNKGGGDRSNKHPMGAPSGDPDAPPTYDQMGLTRYQAKEFIAVSKIDPAAIRAVAEEATKDNRRMTKADVKRLHPDTRDGRGRRPRKKSSPKPEPTKERRGNRPADPVTAFGSWLFAAGGLIDEFGTGRNVLERCLDKGYPIDARINSLKEIAGFVADILAAIDEEMAGGDTPATNVTAATGKDLPNAR